MLCICLNFLFYLVSEFMFYDFLDFFLLFRMTMGRGRESLENRTGFYRSTIYPRFSSRFYLLQIPSSSLLRSFHLPFSFLLFLIFSFLSSFPLYPTNFHSLQFPLPFCYAQKRTVLSYNLLRKPLVQKGCIIIHEGLQLKIYIITISTK